MADGYVEITTEKINSREGLNEINRMIKTLFDLVAGDGEQVRVFNGNGSPEGSVVAGVGSIYMRVDGGASTSIYVKESGTGATGWIAK